MEKQNLKLSLRNSISVRLIVIGVLILLFLIPVMMIKDMVYERQMRKQEAFDEISSKWGYPQTLTGPYLSIPYWEYNKTQDTKGNTRIIKTKQYAHFLPENLNFNGHIFPEMRHRGIYKVVVYNTKLNINGNFEKIDFSKWKIDKQNILWDEATINLGITDLRSIRRALTIDIQDTSLAFNPETATHNLIRSGVSVNLKWENTKTRKFNFILDLNGSSDLNFVPLGKTTIVKIHSKWQNPKFDGSFLPSSESVKDTGFEAKWIILHLNRPYPQAFTGSLNNITESAFGVNLKMPVDEYQKNTRAGKYAILILSLTFIIFFFVQVLNKIRIHPIQYIIVGLAIMVFYSLLIAISEQLSFNWAYFISSMAIISLIGLYVLAIIKNKSIAILLSSLLIILYSFIFTIIQLQDYALLIGSIGLFIVLAIIMYLSRNIDWYYIEFDK